jgi:hypothetical protein
LDIQGEVVEEDFGPFCLPVGTPVSLDNTTPILGSSVMASTIVRLLDDAFKDGYDPYGISGSPIGSLASLDDTKLILGSSVMASTIMRLLDDAFKDGYDPYGISGSPACSLDSLDDATPVASLPESTVTHYQSDSSIYRFVIRLILP